jgi:hypothetical protein
LGKVGGPDGDGDQGLAVADADKNPLTVFISTLASTFAE